MAGRSYTYEELEALTERLQREVSRHIKIEQDLFKARDALDADIARLRVQQQLNSRALQAKSQPELAAICLQTVIEAFEFECAAMLRWDRRAGELERLGAFSLERLPRRLRFDPSVLKGERSLIFDRDHPLLASWSELDLVQIMVCPFCDESGGLDGLVIAGRTRAKAAYYEPIGPQLKAPFAVMVQQIGALWLSYRLNVIVRERKYRVLFHRSNDGILLVDLHGRILDTNQRALEMFGYTLAEMTAMSVFDLSEPDAGDEARERFARIVDTGSVRFERNCLTKSGAIFPAEVSASIFELDGEPMVHGLIRDLTDLKRSQRQLVLSERMAALGQLIAGVAHEINTPVGVIRASIGNIEASLARSLGELPRLIQRLDPATLTRFLELLERARVSPPRLSSREERRQRRTVAEQLASLGVADAEPAAELLAQMGICDQLEPIAQLLAGQGRELLESAYAMSSLQRNADNIRAAVEQATKVVFALRKFSHDDPSGATAPADLVDSIETVLTLYHNKLKQGVEVIRRFETLPQVRCRPDELSQVWTNLIHNAIQAMDNRGRLEVGAARRGDEVEVCVIDDGPGIAPEIADRIFEPFFTTKPAGEGSGLGLDICRKIVERHGGTISVDSSAGRTAFAVRLPIDGGGR